MTDRPCSHPDCGFAAADVCAREGCPGDETVAATPMITLPGTDIDWEDFQGAINYFDRLLDGHTTDDTIEVDGSQMSVLILTLNDMARAIARFRTNQSIAEGAVLDQTPQRDPEVGLLVHLNEVLVRALGAAQPVIAMRSSTLSEILTTLSQGKAIHDAVATLMAAPAGSAAETDARINLARTWEGLHS